MERTPSGSNSDLLDTFIAFFRQLESSALEKKEDELVVASVAFNDLAEYDSEVAEKYLKHPERLRDWAEEALRSEHEESHVSVQMQDTRRIKLASLRTKHIGELFTVIGTVATASPVRSKPTELAFQCQRCGTMTYIPQTRSGSNEPAECQGCERSGPFVVNRNQSEYEDYQRLTLEQRHKGVGTDDEAETLEVELIGDLAGRATPGETVAVTGAVQLADETLSTTIPDKYLDAHSLTEADPNAHIEITDDDIEKILEIADRDDIYEAITGSIAPSVHGNEHIKLPLALQLASGVRKRLPDESTIRGTIHVGIIGDPGSAKSQMVRAAARLSPRSVVVSGESSSEVGLTAGAYNTSSGWETRGGAVVKANHGLAVIENAHSLRSEEKVALSNVIADQQVDVSKASVVDTLPAQTSTTIVGRPKFGRFDQYEPIAPQVDLPPGLLSNLDLTFIVRDDPDPKSDSGVAEFILDSNKAGEMRTQAEKIPASAYDEDEIETASELVEPVIDRELLIKYFVYARQNCFPTLSEEAKEVIRDFYVDFRAKGSDEDVPIPLTAQKLEGLVRLAEASARLRLSDTVTEEDAERVTEIVESCLQNLGIDPDTGEFDAEIVETGTTKSQKDRIKALRQLIYDIGKQDDNDGFAPKEQIFQRAVTELDINEKKAQDEIESLRRKGELYEPRTGYLRLTNTDDLE
ncbi:minichromosome maintenance protein MCM [Halopelagius longus]|uniref:DNA helicase n=2 Tax=Halopelagius longus TaxID=1236180 RepID=A0A1H1GUH1_9EURY|nr:minichromosome maintenance protein MCM [Halopelagius longus]RDI69561.1 AAA family ATPase [Halopelagius longus]SDR16713.1 replicative DNA helicase Mcm [Halopelagius longus]